MPRRIAILALLCLACLESSCVFETRPQASRILFLGNSITYVQANEDFGWTVSAGMAASATDKDYVHQTIRILREKGMDVEAVLGTRDCEICDGVFGEHMETLDDIRHIKPRYAVVQLGENSDAIQINSGRLTQEYRFLLEGLKKRGVKDIFCISNWDEASPEDPHNQAILRAIRQFPDVHWVDIGSLAHKPENYGDPALYSNPGVLWHPGDLGMLRIAEFLAEAIWEQR